jgi:hypothetical protein
MFPTPLAPTAVCCPADLVVDVYVPPGFAAPRRVSPQGAFWSASQSMLRWPLGTVGQGAAGVVVAAFRIKGGAEAAAAGLARCHAVLKLQGEGGCKPVQAGSTFDSTQYLYGTSRPQHPVTRSGLIANCRPPTTSHHAVHHLHPQGEGGC